MKNTISVREGYQGLVHHAGTMRADWIKDRLKQIGAKQSDLADYLGLPQPRANEIIQGKRKIQFDEIYPLSRFLKLPVTVVLDRMTTPPDDEDKPTYTPDWDVVYVRGKVRAGYFQEEQDKFDLEDETDRKEIYTFGPALKYSSRYALKVEGTSMDKLYPEGSYIVVVPLSEYFGDLKTGVKVVCQRAQAGKFETTVKELEIKDGEYWLWPRSNDPQWQTPIRVGTPDEWETRLEDPEHQTGDETAIIGVVVQAIKNELPE